MNKMMYTVGYPVLGFLGLILYFVGFSQSMSVDPATGMPVNSGPSGLAVLGGLMLFVSAIIFFAWIWNLWASLPESHRKHSPAKATLLLLIPLWNIYWIFEAVWGWTKSYNAFLQEENVNLQQASEGIALSIPILMLTSVIPGLNLLTGPAAVLMTVVLMSSSIDNVNKLKKKLVEGGGEAQPATETA
jgi:hypothetical protein